MEFLGCRFRVFFNSLMVGVLCGLKCSLNLCYVFIGLKPMSDLSFSNICFRDVFIYSLLNFKNSSDMVLNRYSIFFIINEIRFDVNSTRLFFNLIYHALEM